VIADLRIDAKLGAAAAAGDPRLAESLMANLVGNALRHNVPGGWALIETATVGGRAVLRVSNSGPVIPPSEVDRLFQPFQRLGDERVRRRDGGHGLGLAIVRAIAVAHGAELTARARPEGGLDIAVTFPPQSLMTVERPRNFTLLR
jgi:signal transduction histidine kinase